MLEKKRHKNQKNKPINKPIEKDSNQLSVGHEERILNIYSNCK